MIVGTAGHIDHGKTALVHALTGVDTDRLPEEKNRGITIELGYAHLRGPEGQDIAFVDVPGHEKLVRTMVAGASGLDHALLLVAADDGVMPQTREHLTILRMLGLRSGAAVVTKIDRCDAPQVAQRLREVQALLAESGLAEFALLAVSAHRGDGMTDLRAHLYAAAKRQRATQATGAGFRMALDRAFSLEGMGTVVAGSIQRGGVRVGESVCLAHAPETRYRVRSLHCHNAAVQAAQAGQRCAVGLVGLERAAVTRGMTLCDPRVAQSSERVDVWLELAASEARPLRSGTPLHLHVGTQDVMASVAILGQASLQPGEAALAQLVLTQAPAPMWWGDRLVLRDASATRTVAGALVLDVHAPTRYRQTPARLALLHGLRENHPAQRLRQVLAHSPYGLSATAWLTTQGETDWPFDPASLPETVYVPREEWLIGTAALASQAQAVLGALGQHHAKHPEELGPDANRLRRVCAPRMPQSLWRHLLSHLRAQGQIGERHGFVHLAAHGEQLREADRIVAERALPLLLQGHFDPPWVRDIAAATRLPEVQVRSVLMRLGRNGEVYAIVKDLYYHPQVVFALAQLARACCAQDGEVTAALFRDATGLGRKRAIQILEFFDRIGFLRRVGDRHLMRPGTTLFAPGGLE